MILNSDIDFSGVIVYVIFEFCCYYGCILFCFDLLIEYGIKKVFIGFCDLNLLVFGKGVK